MRAPTVARYLAVPLQMAPLLFIVMFSVLSVLATYGTIAGIPLGLLLLFGLIRYSFALLESVTNGAAEPPILTIEMLNPIGEMRSVVVLIIVAAVFFATDAASYWMGPFVKTIVGLATMALLLAIVTVQSATGSLLQALNPLRCFALMRRLRMDYVIVLGCAIVLYLLSYWIARFDFIPLMGRIALIMYAWLATFALIGGMLRERRDDIGLDEMDEPDPIELDPTLAIEREHDYQVDRIYAAWRSGAHLNAWQAVTTQLDRSHDPLYELSWLYAKISRWPDPRLADRLAQELVIRLLADKHYGPALSWVSLRLRVNPEFRPLASHDAIVLAEKARDVGDRRIARALLKDFQRLYPNDSLQTRAEQLEREVER